MLTYPSMPLIPKLAPITHFLLTYGGVILMGLLAIWTFWPEDDKPKRRTIAHRGKKTSSVQTHLNPHATNLKSLLHGDIAQANRILASLRKRYPGKSEQWLYEKAILDLERDRRC